MNIKTTPLDNWIANLIGLQSGGNRGAIGLQSAFNRGAIREYQLKKLIETVSYAKEKSRFYAKHFSEVLPDGLRSFDDFNKLPFTDAKMLSGAAHDFLCVPPHEVSRIVTLGTSGTTGPSKRVFFTRGDTERTADFFNHGMTTFCEKGDRVMIFMPGETEGTVGALLREGLSRFGAQGIIYGPVFDLTDAAAVMREMRCSHIVGMASQIFALVMGGGGLPPLKSVLLCADYVPKTLSEAIERETGCEVYGHYGTTETGLGGGVECAAKDGYHLREADLYFEIVDECTGEPKPDGEYGEVVFTTLTREAMPLVRYKTGDRSRFIAEKCLCGSVLRRMERVSGRVGGDIELKNGAFISLPRLDEILYSVSGLISFDAEIEDCGQFYRLLLSVQSCDEKRCADEVLAALDSDGQIGRAIDEGVLTVEIAYKNAFISNGTKKRKIIQRG